MSKDKYPGIFPPQMETIVFIILQIFYATRAVLKFGDIRSGVLFTPIARERKDLMDRYIYWMLATWLINHLMSRIFRGTP